MGTNLKNKAYDIIKERIINCEYKPNTFLNETSLIQEIDASRTPIREALNKLEQEGFVQILAKRGVMVTNVTMTEIHQTFEVRLLLEPYIVTHYIQNMDLNRLTELYTENKALIEAKPNPDGFCHLDDVLHRVISSACPNKYILETLEHIYNQNMRIRILSGKNIWERHVEAAKEHLDLMTAIINYDVEEAVKHTVNHLIKSKEAAIQSFINEQIPVN